MKNTIYFFAVLWIMATVAACNKDTQKAPELSGPPALETEATTTAISLWNKAGLRESPGEKGKYLTNINFGETLIPTGEKQEIAEEKRTYMEVTLSDGKKGWVNAYLVAVNASAAAVTAPLAIYQRPDLATIKSVSFEPGEVIAIGDVQNGWREAWGFERKKSGWIQYETNYSPKPEDVTTAILYQKALAEANAAKRKPLLEAIAQNNALRGSAIMALVEEKLREYDQLPQLAENQLMIAANTVNVRSEPSNEGENVLFQLPQGTIVNVLEKGERQQIREMNDYWYRIEYSGQIGWIYGYYTSKKAE